MNVVERKSGGGISAGGGISSGYVTFEKLLFLKTTFCYNVSFGCLTASLIVCISISGSQMDPLLD